MTEEPVLPVPLTPLERKDVCEALTVLAARLRRRRQYDPTNPARIKDAERAPRLEALRKKVQNVEIDY